MSACWCIEYHFTDLAGAEVCEHDCHWGALDPAGAAYWQREREIEEQAYQAAARAFRGEVDPPPPPVNPAGYLRGLYLTLPMTWIEDWLPPSIPVAPTRGGKAWLLDRLRWRR